MTHDEQQRGATGQATGRIIFLNGASSAGKSTLSRALQQALEDPFLHCSSDMLAPGWSPRAGSDWWAHARPRFFAGFHGCIAALAGAGNDLIVDHIIELPQWRAELRGLLAPFDVFLVGVRCSLAEIERRERARGDRRIGEGREHVEVDRIHELGRYDLEIDTTGRDPSGLASEVLQHWRQRSSSVLHVPA